MARNNNNQSLADLSRIAVAIACWFVVHYIQEIEQTIQKHREDLEKIRSSAARLEERVSWLSENRKRDKTDRGD